MKGEDFSTFQNAPGGLWYYFKASASGVASVTTAGSSVDTIVSVFNSTKCTGLGYDCAGFNDDVSATVKTSSITFDVTIGTTYTLIVSGKSDLRGTLVTNLEMIGSFTCTPACGLRKCGTNGCGGQCGTCGSGEECNVHSQCVPGAVAPFVPSSTSTPANSPSAPVSGSTAASPSKSPLGLSPSTSPVGPSPSSQCNAPRRVQPETPKILRFLQVGDPKP